MLSFRAFVRRCHGIHHVRKLTTATLQRDEPLRILFCGSDDFSAASLRALHKYSQEAQSNILSIDVAAKEDKPSGRGLKKLKAPLIKSVAEELDLPLHQFNTFTGWTPPSFHHSRVTSINLIIAVSFGLLVPSRIINGAAYGGLNVHPSLLPDLRGAAPLNWAIIKGYNQTGVSIQTLHPTRFDEGVVLAQTEPVAIQHNAHVDQLRQIVAPMGADLLVQTIRQRRYLPTYKPRLRSDIAALNLAPKIRTADKIMDPHRDDVATILRKNRAIPKLFGHVLAAKNQKGTKSVRIIFGTSMREAPADSISRKVISTVKTGLPFVVTKIEEEASNAMNSIFITCKDGGILEIPLMLVEGRREGPAAQAAASSGLLEQPKVVGDHNVYLFRGLAYH